MASLDENADCVGKIGDFGLAQKVAPHCVVVLNNFCETAPETWGDLYNLCGSASYDEKADVFSYAIILWRLFYSDNSSGTDLYGDASVFEVRKKIREVRTCAFLCV